MSRPTPKGPAVRTREDHRERLRAPTVMVGARRLVLGEAAPGGALGLGSGHQRAERNCAVSGHWKGSRAERPTRLRYSMTIL